jgi:hypothetical protein
MKDKMGPPDHERDEQLERYNRDRSGIRRLFKLADAEADKNSISEYFMRLCEQKVPVKVLQEDGTLAGGRVFGVTPDGKTIIVCCDAQGQSSDFIQVTPKEFLRWQKM